ncbi:MAG: OmpA family protein, partial [Candidatus Electrothrix sp. AR4]|nr:OmpA family protein [Candidatus Electrothrix sp. AR4]
RDKDGVPDYWDQCPDNTAQELRFGVERDGCPQDSDKDQHPDYRDACRLDTTTDLAHGVDNQGCPVDSDQDNIPDYIDKCPESVPDVQVDHHGCAIVISVTFPSDNSFESGDTMLSAKRKKELRDYMRKLPTSLVEKIQVIAHADAQGESEDNITLSQKRAEAVADFLATLGISKTHIEARGIGEEQPVASNDTAEGRAQNRRFELNVHIKVQTP